MEYNSWGNGDRIILALHGFGRNLDDFKHFTAPFESEYSIYSVNIFFHGKSEIINRDPEKEPVSTDEFANFFEVFFDHINGQKISIIGYSLGGRLGMKITELLPKRVEALYLFAPDGLIKSRWYVLFSHNLIGRWVFRFLIKHENRYTHILNLFVNLRLISSKLENFIRSQTASKELREKVFYVWTSLRKIEPDFKQLKRSIETYNVPVKIFIGTYDNIIPIKNARKVKRKIPEIQVILIRSGHKMLTEKIAEEIKDEII